MSKYGVISGPYFLVFVLNTEIYAVFKDYTVPAFLIFQDMNAIYEDKYFCILGVMLCFRVFM